MISTVSGTRILADWYYVPILEQVYDDDVLACALVSSTLRDILWSRRCKCEIVSVPGDVKINYIGERKNDLFHGTGTMTFENGDSYKGQWKDGEFHVRHWSSHAITDDPAGSYTTRGRGHKYQILE